MTQNPAETTPKSFTDIAAQDVAEVLVGHSDQMVVDLLEREKTEHLPAGFVEREIRAASEVGSRVMRLAQLSTVHTGEDLMVELVEDARRLRRLKSDEISAHDPLKDQVLRERIRTHLSALTNMTPEDLYEKSGGAPVAQAETTDRKQYAEGILALADQERSVSLYSDGPGGLQTYGTDTWNNPMKSDAWNAIRWSTVQKESSTETDPTNIPVEAIAFDVVQDTRPVKKTVKEWKRPLIGKIKQVDKVVDGYEEFDKYIEMPDGSKERLIDVSYIFNPRLMGNNAYSNAEGDTIPAYREFAGVRLGSHAGIRMRLPESAAMQLKNALAKDPQLIRDIHETAVETRAPKAFTEYWHDGNPQLPEGRRNPLRPPFEKLPANWKLWVMDGVTPGRGTLADPANEQAQAFDRTYAVDTVPFR